jgi:hypothetical protein
MVPEREVKEIKEKYYNTYQRVQENSALFGLFLPSGSSPERGDPGFPGNSPLRPLVTCQTGAA